MDMSLQNRTGEPPVGDARPARSVPSNKNGKRFGLDLIRVILSFGIIVWHYQHFAYHTASPVNLVRDQQPFYSLFYFFYNFGGEYRIPAFWCLSGFLFFWKYNAKIADRRVGTKEFFILRLSRLYPVHILTLMIVLFLQVLYRKVNGGYFVFQDNDIKHFFLQLFFASNWGFENGSSFNGPIWSLSVEVLIYFAFFFIARYLGKAIYVNILVLVVLAAMRIGHISSPIMHCMACFYAGGLASFAFLKMLDSDVYRKRFNAIAFALAIFIPVVAAVFRLYEHRFFSALFVMIYAPVIIYLSVQDITVPARLQKIVETFGNMIYSTYLVHFPLQLIIALFCTYYRIAIPMYSPVFFIAYNVAVFSLAYLLWYHFERPVQSAIRRWWKEVGSVHLGTRVAPEKVAA